MAPALYLASFSETNFFWVSARRSQKRRLGALCSILYDGTPVLCHGCNIRTARFSLTRRLGHVYACTAWSDNYREGVNCGKHSSLEPRVGGAIPFFSLCHIASFAIKYRIGSRNCCRSLISTIFFFALCRKKPWKIKKKGPHQFPWPCRTFT